MKKTTAGIIATIIFFVLLIIVIRKFLKRDARDAGEVPTADTADITYTGHGKPATPNFKCDEFDCKDGTAVPVEYYGNLQALMTELQKLRDHVGTPIFVNSGYRTPAYNAGVGGATHSRHLRARAADIRIPGHTPAQVHALIEALIATGTLHNGGLGSYSSFTHYDVRPEPKRWNG